MALFKAAAESKETERIAAMIVKLAQKYIRTGGHLSMFELLSFTGHMEKVLNSGDKQLKEELLALLEDRAKSAPGALDTELSKKLTAPKKVRMSNNFNSTNREC